MSDIKPLLGLEHFSVDGTLLRAWASHRSLERIDAIDDDLTPPGVKQDLEHMPQGRNVPKVTSSACCFPTKPTAPALIARRACSRRPLVLGAYLSFLGHCVMENLVVAQVRR